MNNKDRFMNGLMSDRWPVSDKFVSQSLSKVKRFHFAHDAPKYFKILRLPKPVTKFLEEEKFGE